MYLSIPLTVCLEEGGYFFTHVIDCTEHNWHYAIGSSKLQKEPGWESSLQFEERIEKTLKWYLDNQHWMEKVTSGDYQKCYDEQDKNSICH